MQSAVGVIGFADRHGPQQRRGVGNDAGGGWRHAGNCCQQLAGVRCLRGTQHLLTAAEFHRLATVHHQHLIGDVSHHAHVVGDEQHRAAGFLLQCLNKLQDVFLRGDIQGGGGFVTNEECRLHHHGHGDDDALTLPAAELVRIALPHSFGVGQTHLRQHVQHRTAALAGWPIGMGA